MNYVVKLLLSIMTIHTLYAMDHSDGANYKKQLPLKPLLMPLPSSSRTAPSDTNEQVEDDVQPVLSKERLDEMAYVFSQAPEEAQMIVNHLKDPTYFEDEEYRSAIFVGEPGTGKTTTALAIGHKMMVESGWKYKMLDCGAFLGKFRNQTAIKLRQYLRSIIALRVPIILIIDELNRLLEHAQSEHHDTDTTSSVLWTFLDAQSGNNQFFFIGTMNAITKLPKPYKDRILFEYITFAGITDDLKRAQALRYYLTRGKAQLDAAITDQVLVELLKDVNNSSGRLLKRMAGLIKRLYRKGKQQGSEVMLITETLIKQAAKEFAKRKKAIEYNHEEETEAQRQERLHKKTLDLQEKHFVQQQIKQDLMQQFVRTKYNYDNGRLEYTEQKLSTDQLVSIMGVYDADQRILLSDVMARFQKSMTDYLKALEKEANTSSSSSTSSQKGWFSGWF